MSKLLTISIPTFNRAQMLEKQLKYLASDIQGYEEECEIVLSDNCSTDDTTEIINKWKSALSPNITFRYYRNEINIGGMPNIVSCLQKATGKFVWSLGDDDTVQPGTVGYIISKIKEHDDLSLILLNGYGRDLRTNKVLIERLFDSTTDRPSTNSASEFEHFLETCMGGVLFISSAVYNTKILHQSFSTWPDSANNLASQAYWVAYCAARGKFIVTPALYTECAMGIGFTDKDPKWGFKMLFLRGLPDVYVRLMRTGYSKRFCFSMILHNIRSVNSWRIFFGAFRRWPAFAAEGFFYYVRDIMIATWLFVMNNGKGELPGVKLN